MLFSDMSILLFSADTVLAIASSTDRSSLKPTWMTCNINFSVLSISVMFFDFSRLGMEVGYKSVPFWQGGTFEILCRLRYLITFLILEITASMSLEAKRRIQEIETTGGRSGNPCALFCSQGMPW